MFSERVMIYPMKFMRIYYETWKVSGIIASGYTLLLLLVSNTAGYIFYSHAGSKKIMHLLIRPPNLQYLFKFTTRNKDECTNIEIWKYVLL